MINFKQSGGFSPEKEEEKKEDPQVEEINKLMSDAEEFLREGTKPETVRKVIFGKAAEMINEEEGDEERLDLLKERLKNRVNLLDDLPEQVQNNLGKSISKLDKEKAKKVLEGELLEEELLEEELQEN